jgi:hypothetical protein
MNDRSLENKKQGGERTPPIQALVHVGREKFALDFLGKQVDFDAASWDVSMFRDRPATQKDRILYFTRYGTTEQLLPQIYAEVVKSWIILERQSVGNMRNRSTGARILWEAILLRRRNDPAAFRWQDLCEEDLSQAELLMRERWTLVTTYKRGLDLLCMITFLATRGVCPHLYYVLQTPCPEDSRQHTIAGQEARKTKLPSMRALEGVADIYSTYAKDPADRLRAAALAILVVTGFRLGELLTLPLECEVTESSLGTTRYGLRYYKEKARRAERLFDVRWLTVTGAELAQRALTEIREITARARVLEQNPNRVPLPGYQWADRMSPDEVLRVTGIRHLSSVHHISRDKLPRHQEGDTFFYHAGEVEAYLLSERVEPLWTLDRRDGTYQMFSETLFIAFQNSFHATRRPCSLLVEPMTYDHLRSFMTGKRGTKSAFERFGICEEDGTSCRITSHQFRHWLNDLADKGGLPVDLQTRWMGREHPQDTHAYHHATVEERLQWVKDGIRTGEICGTIATVYFALPEEERDVFLEGHIQAVHFTPLGLCTHDFAIDPCPYYLNCTKGCSDYLRTKGNQQERKHLLQVQCRTKQALEMAQAQAAAGNGETAQAWREHYEETLAGVKAALAIDDDPTVSDGTMVQPFQGHPSRFQPL